MDIETFKSQLDIVQVIESYIPLKKFGANYQAICPFHSEKSPSFVVSYAKQIYKCFGCSASGDVLKFVQEYKKLEFAEAVAELAYSYNLANPLSKGGQSEYKVLQEKLGQLSNVFVANLLEKGYLGNHSQDLQGEAQGVTLGGNDRSQQEKKHDLSLKANASKSTSVAHKLREYLFKRGFNEEDITAFSFGYCKGEEWRQFFSLEQAKKAGIVSEKGWCLFSNRLTITLYNTSYKPIGFVARTHPYFNFRNSSKYINSKEGILYQKSKNFYNFWRAKSHIQSSKKVLIVEGYMDALAAWKMGIKNCIATGGTAFNKTFLAQLNSINPEITFLFDNDDAGQKNILNAIKVCVENGYGNVYKGNLNEDAKDLGEVLEKGYLGNHSQDLQGLGAVITDKVTPTPAPCKNTQSTTATTTFANKPEQNLNAHTKQPKNINLHTKQPEAAGFEMRNCDFLSGGEGVTLGGNDPSQQEKKRDLSLKANANITKTEGIRYYLKTTLNDLKSAKDKDNFLAQWKTFVRAQNNHFYKLELMGKTNRALGFDVFNPQAQQKPTSTPLRAQVYKSILVNQECDYIASEYLFGEELGEFGESFKTYLRTGTKDDLAIKLELDSTIEEIHDSTHFRRAIWLLLKAQVLADIAKAKIHKDYKRARELAHHLHKLQRTLSLYSGRH